MNRRNRAFLGVVLGYLLGVAFLLYNVLTDRTNPGFARVRSGASVPQIEEVLL